MSTARQMLCANMLLEYSQYSKSGAAASVGNFTQEVGINLPTAFRTSGLDHGSQGLAQWRDSRTHKRLTNYQNFVKKLHPNASAEELWAYYGRMEYQVKFYISEMKEFFPTLHTRLQRDLDVVQLTDAICWEFERPNKQYAHLDNRRKHAKAVYEALKVQERPVALPPPAEKIAQNAERRSVTASAAAIGMGILAWLGTISWPILAIFGGLILVVIIHAAMQRSKALESISEPIIDQDERIAQRVLELLDERAKEELEIKEINNG